MRFDILIQFLVPLAIMAMWALTSLLNKEAQPLPTRGTASNTGPRHGRIRRVAAASRSAPRDSSLRPPRSSVRRLSDGPKGIHQLDPDPFAVGVADEGFMIIGPDNRGNRPQPSSGAQPATAGSGRNSRGPQTRRGSRARPASITGPPRPKEADHQRALTSLVNQSLAQKKNRPLEITPLAASLAPIASPLTQTSLGTTIEHPGSYQLHTALTSTELRGMLGTSSKLREIALLSELLQPPVSLRSPRHRR